MSIKKAITAIEIVFGNKNKFRTDIFDPRIFGDSEFNSTLTRYRVKQQLRQLVHGN